MGFGLVGWLVLRVFLFTFTVTALNTKVIDNLQVGILKKIERGLDPQITLGSIIENSSTNR